MPPFGAVTSFIPTRSFTPAIPIMHTLEEMETLRSPLDNPDAL